MSGRRWLWLALPAPLLLTVAFWSPRPAIAAGALAIGLAAQGAFWWWARGTHARASWLAAVLEGAPDAVLEVTRDDRIALANPSAAALLHGTPHDLRGTPLSRVLALEAQSASAHLNDVVARRCDGSTLSVDIAMAQVGDRLIVSLRDTSERKKIEQAKDELLSTISHELRTPLTSIVGSLTLLRIGAAPDLGADMQRLIDGADRNSRQLIRLINDLLDLDRIDAGKLPIVRVPLDLRDVLVEACRAAEGLATATGISLTSDVPHRIVSAEGDAGRLHQVIVNLVANAVNVAPAGSSVRLALSVDEKRAVVSVADRGPGIPVHMRDRLFDRFESRKLGQRREGTGLGLTIAREIVRRHDGAIWFEDRIGGGTRFAFALPLIEGAT
ncbi:sensor histidine kinase [Sphingomonas endophytica]|uniref:sensor histidine kinase n=1 Tax=Sphingomonas endophytica TaxID=869719 RepID=UPI000B0CB74C|nr:HAMP domain-containing sensor histidine kinase [Sphingomonas endophytica]